MDAMNKRTEEQTNRRTNEQNEYNGWNATGNWNTNIDNKFILEKK